MSSAVSAVTSFVGDVVGGIGDAVSGVVDAVGNVVGKVADTVGNVVDGALKNPLKTAALVAAAVFAPELAGAALGDAAAAEAAAIAATESVGAVALPAGSILDGVVLEGGMSVAADSLYGAVSTATGATVAVSTTGAALGNTVASGLAYQAASAGMAGGWLATAKGALDAANTVSKVMQITNQKTGVKQIVAQADQAPTGWTIDPNFNQMAAQGVQTAPMFPGSTTAAGIVSPSDDSIQILPMLAAAAGILFLIKARS